MIKLEKLKYMIKLEKLKYKESFQYTKGLRFNKLFNMWTTSFYTVWRYL